MAAIRAVLDTDVLLGTQRDILIRAAERGRFTLCLSRFGAWELGRVAQRMGFGEEKHKAYFRRLDAIAELVDHNQYQGDYPEWLQDSDDRPLVATAAVAQTNYLVTYNIQTFQLAPGSHPLRS